MTSRKPRKKADNATVRLVGYCRVSTEEQAAEGVSMDAQRERLAAYCKAHDHELVAVKVDEGISGKVKPAQRDGLARALKLVKDGEADGLIVLKLDRLSRSVRDVLDLADSAQRSKWRLVSVSENLDTESPQGRFTLTLLAALAQLEREQVAERTSFALDAIAREGRGRSRFTPYGWRTADGSTENRAGDRSELVPHAEEQSALRCIVLHRKQGKGARRIATALNRVGANPRSGNTWTPESVAAILRRLERWESAGVDPLAA
jgi:site-specific DNA recombinase